MSDLSWETIPPGENVFNWNLSDWEGFFCVTDVVCGDCTKPHKLCRADGLGRMGSSGSQDSLWALGRMGLEESEVAPTKTSWVDSQLDATQLVCLASLGRGGG